MQLDFSENIQKYQEIFERENAHMIEYLLNLGKFLLETTDEYKIKESPNDNCNFFPDENKNQKSYQIEFWRKIQMRPFLLVFKHCVHK